jgi:CRP-like cAMP-binding protein
MTTLLRLGERLPATEIGAGEVLLPEGERTGLLYVLIEGEIEIRKEEVEIDVISQPGAVFGEISALIDIPHMATVRARTPARVLRIENATRFLEDNPDSAVEVAKLLAERLNNVVGYLADLKRQFAGRDHMSMVDEVLGSLVNQQRTPFKPGSNRDRRPVS